LYDGCYNLFVQGFIVSDIATASKNKSTVSKPHDKAFQSAMRDLRVARDFFRHHLPAVILEKIDLDTLQLHPTTFIDPELRRLVSDLLYSAEFKDKSNKVFLYLALDQQTTPDALMTFRMLKYTIRILDDHLSKNKTAVLPVVIPMVFYNGKVTYPYSTSIFDLFGAQKDLAKQWMFTQFHLVDLSQIPDEEICKHPWSGFLEMLFKHVKARDMMVYLEQLSDIVDQLVAAEADNYLLTMVKYAIEKSQIRDREAFYHWVQTHLSPPLETETMTLAEQLRQEGREEGREEVRALAEQLRREGEQTLLIKQLYRRFPSLNARYEDRIRNACTEELLLWGERILDANNIDEVFGK
jgi:recombination-promoting nuclease RpnB